MVSKFFYRAQACWQRDTVILFLSVRPRGRGVSRGQYAANLVNCLCETDLLDCAKMVMHETGEVTINSHEN